MADKTQCTKTYLAVVRGEGILHGEDLTEREWFTVNRPIRNANGIEKKATTRFRFVAGQGNDYGRLNRPRAAIVLAQPQTGRWHQIRKHLNGLSHPILGDSTHGNSQTNREWRNQYGLASERLCLHLCRLDLGGPDGLHVACPLWPDLHALLRRELPTVLEHAESVLCEEGVVL